MNCTTPAETTTFSMSGRAGETTPGTELDAIFSCHN